ncbi:MAG: ROK family protein [Oscillospiraceae bacterium]|nr:ROK family protein [Oscillospiraceae bacterium]
METLARKINAQHEMIDAIRMRKYTDCTVEHLRNTLSISRTTADKNYSALLDSNIIQKSDRSSVLCNDCAYFLGISIGSVNIRAILLGLNFEPVDLEVLNRYEYLKELPGISGFNVEECGSYSYAFHAKPKAQKSTEPQSEDSAESSAVAVFSHIQHTVGDIVNLFLKQAEASRSGNGHSFPLMGIGFGVTGPVDYANATWTSSPRIESAHGITIRDLIRHTNMELAKRLGIFFSFDNNAKAAIVSEYQNLMEKNHGAFNDDLALLYIGTGVGSAFVINKRLLRGRQNYSGELGHAFMPNTGTKLLTIEQLLCGECDYREQIPYILHMLNCVFGIDRFVLVGHSMFEYIDSTDSNNPNKRIHLREDLLPHLMDRRMQFTVSSTKQYCMAEEGRGTPTTAAIGAAIEAYRCLCRYDFESNSVNRTNLAFDISW